MRTIPGIWKILTPAIVLIIISGCASYETPGNQKYQCQSTDECIKLSDYSRANEFVEAEAQARKKGNDKILYYLDKGAVLQIMGKYKESSKSLHEAESIIEELYTKSVSKEVSSYFSNDLALPYEGEDFEQVMVNVIKALNFLYTEDFTGARVEARKVDNRLNVLSDKMEGKNVYKQDALARYISGFCYEATGELNNAYIDYKKAYSAYKQYNENYGTGIPDAVKKDLLRLSEALGFSDQYDDFKEEFGFMPYTKQKDLKGMGEVMFVIYDGQAPFKTDAGNLIPVFNDRGQLVSSVEVTTEEDKTYVSYSAEDITAIAIKNLAQKMEYIQSINAARDLVKGATAEAGKLLLNKALENVPYANLVAGMFMDAAKKESDLADTRSWKTLPGRIHLLRMPADGNTSIKMKMFLKDGSQRERIVNIKVKPGAKRAIPVYCFM